VSGTPTQYTKTANSGNPMTSFLCGTCGSTLWRESPKYAGLKLLKAGTVDNPTMYTENTPGVEIFVRSRPVWVAAVEGAQETLAG